MIGPGAGSGVAAAVDEAMRYCCCMLKEEFISLEEERLLSVLSLVPGTRYGTVLRDEREGHG